MPVWYMISDLIINLQARSGNNAHLTRMALLGTACEDQPVKTEGKGQLQMTPGRAHEAEGFPVSLL